MALSFIILTLLIAGSIIAGSYSMYLPFFISMQQNAQQVEAYYMARAAMERWQLVIQYHPLGFAWSGGMADAVSRWYPGEDNIPSHISISSIWWITNNQEAYSQYNELYISNPSNIYVWYDDTTNPEHYYQNIPNYTKYVWDEFSIDIKIPSEFKETLWEENGLLCSSSLEDISCDADGDSIYDDTIIQRNRQWQEWRWAFTILPYTQINMGAGRGAWLVNYDQDTNLRENIINIDTSPTLLFNDTFNPIAQNDAPDSWTWHNWTWDGFSGIQNQTFSDLLANNDIEYNILWLQMLHPAMRIDGKIYPYIHYKINGTNKIASTTNTIHAYAQTQQNTITIKATRPNILSQQKGSFSIHSSLHE